MLREGCKENKEKYSDIRILSVKQTSVHLPLCVLFSYV